MLKVINQTKLLMLITFVLSPESIAVVETDDVSRYAHICLLWLIKKTVK